MRTSIQVGGAASGRSGDWRDTVAFVREAEKLGVDIVWSAEAWGADAVSTLAYLAAVTDRMSLGTGIMQISARTPVMTAMTALSMAAMTGDRFILGLGVSGPQVVEGLHGVSFDRPLQRLRENVEIIQQALAGERIAYAGDHYQLPLPGGQGKSLRLVPPANPNIPLWLATLAPRALAYTGEVADGWAGTAFVPSGAAGSIGVIGAAAVAAGRDADSVEFEAGGTVQFGRDVEQLMVPRKPGIAFTLGAMGSSTTNFYNDAYSRAGYAEAAAEVQCLWLDHKRDQAAAAVPDELVLETNFLGSTEQVTQRVQAYADAGVTVLRCQAEGSSLSERLDNLVQIVDIVKGVSG